MLRDREFVILSFENLENCPKMLPKIIEKLPGMWFGGCAWGYMGLDGFPVFLGVPLGPPGPPGGAGGLCVCVCVCVCSPVCDPH